jgi:uncharacterized protein with von Willebrand factor type A (vWA) domain
MNDTRQLWQRDIESVFHADHFDLDDWLTAGQIIPTLERDNETAGQEFCGQPLQDGFFSLYKGAPSFSDPTDRKLAPLADLMKRGMQTPEWSKLRENTIGQQVASAIGAQHYFQQVLKNLPEEVKEAVRQISQAQNDANGLQLQAEQMQALADLMRGIGNEAEATQAEMQAAGLTSRAELAQDVADSAMADFEQAMAQNEAQITATLNNAAEVAQDHAEATQQMVNAFSVAAGGDPSHVDPSVAEAAMRAMRFNPQLRDLAEMLGWAKRMVRGEWRKATKGNKNMVGYAPEPLNPARMAASELMAMNSAIPAVRLDFTRRMVENAVIHKQFDGDEKQGRGPLVLVRDESGSMSGQRHALAVALEWSLLEVARRDNRDFCSIPFSGEGQFKVWQAPAKGQADPKGLLAHLSHFFGGGTEPYGPINKALDLIEVQSLKADVLVITDGSFDQPAPDFLKRVNAVDAKIVTITIGGWGDAVAGLFSHKCVKVNDLVGERETLREAIAEVV